MGIEVIIPFFSKHGYSYDNMFLLGALCITWYLILALIVIIIILKIINCYCLKKKNTKSNNKLINIDHQPLLELSMETSSN